MAKVNWILVTNKKIKASSLVEVLVALVILMLSFGMAVSLFVKVTKSNRSLQQVENQALVNNYVAETKRLQAYLNETEKLEDKVLIRRVKPYRNNPDLLLLAIELRSDEDSLLHEHKELIYVAEQPK